MTVSNDRFVFRAERGFINGQIESGGIDIEVSDGLITAIHPSDVLHPIPSALIDLGDRTILPGLIDAHTHFLGIDTTRYESLLIDPWEDRALRAAGEASQLVQAGFTSARCLGSPIGPALARAIKAGHVAGPRLIAAGQALCATNGTWDIVAADRRVADLQGMLVDGVDNVRLAVRDRVRSGAMVIKIGLSRGLPGDHSHGWGDDPERQQVAYSMAEIEAAVDEAHAAGITVSAHCIGDGPVGAALDAGIDVIEHGFGINDETRARVAETGTPIVTTFTGLSYGRAAAAASGASADDLARTDNHIARMRADFERGRDMGIEYVLGSDLIGWPTQPQTAAIEEFFTAVEWGMTPTEALLAGTVGAARVLGIGATVGELRVGQTADLVACAGNPTTSIRDLESLDFVVQSGDIKRLPSGWPTTTVKGPAS